MKRTSVVAIVMFAVVGLCVGSALCYRSGKDGGYGEFSIYVSPDTIAKSASCTWVTIHTNMPFGAVDAVSAAVDGTNVEVANTFADDRGYLVVKLKFQDVVALVDPPSATVELNVMVDGEVLGGAATVRVKQ